MKTKANPAIVIGGICLTGKTSLANALIESGGKGSALPAAISFGKVVEGDDLHPPESVDKMRFGIPLNEGDRETWKARVCEKIRTRPDNEFRIITCSALTRSFRDALREAGDVRILFLMFGRESAEKRAKKRLRDTWEQCHKEPGKPLHYYQPAIYPALLDGQYRDLEIPGNDETDCKVFDWDRYPQASGLAGVPDGPVISFPEIAPEIIDWITGCGEAA